MRLDALRRDPEVALRQLHKVAGERNVYAVHLAMAPLHRTGQMAPNPSGAGADAARLAIGELRYATCEWACRLAWARRGDPWLCVWKWTIVKDAFGHPNRALVADLDRPMPVAIYVE